MGHIMTQTNDVIQTFLTLLGFKPEETTIYLTLTQKGALTVLELSRTTGISRTQVYRIVEEMEAKGFIEQIIDEHRKLAQPVPVRELAPLIRQRQSEAVEAERLFPGVRELLEANVGTNQADTKVLFYRGKQGLRQLVWHTLRAQKTVLGYTYRRLEEYLGEDFMGDWRDSFVRKGLLMRDIYSDEYLESIAPTGHIPHSTAHYVSRYVTNTLLTVNLQMDIYNDVVAQYNWHEGEVFGVEIYNSKITGFHKQLFEIVWRQGKAEK